MLNRRRNLYIGILIAIAGILWLGPIAGATGNGEKTFLIPLEQLFGLNMDISCRAAGYGSGSTSCMDTYSRASDVGIILCLLLGVVILICVFQLVRLWVRKRLR